MKLTGALGVFGSENPPDRLLPWHTASCASLQLFGEIQLNAGVVVRALQVVEQAVGRVEEVRDVLGVAVAGVAGPSSNHGNGKCLGTYWSVALALPGLGWAVLPVGPGWANGAPQAPTPALCGALPVSGLPRSWA